VTPTGIEPVLPP